MWDVQKAPAVLVCECYREWDYASFSYFIRSGDKRNRKQSLPKVVNVSGSNVLGQRTIAQTTHNGIPPVYVSDTNGPWWSKKIWTRRLFAVGLVFLGHSVRLFQQNRQSFVYVAVPDVCTTASITQEFCCLV